MDTYGKFGEARYVRHGVEGSVEVEPIDLALDGQLLEVIESCEGNRGLRR